jgi:hypothetical protein
MHLARAWIFIAVLTVAVLPHARATVLTNTWSQAGGGLNPSTYGGNFRPSTLFSDSGSTGSASIAMSGLTNSLGAPSGGIGSAALGAYGGIYSFFASTLTLNLVATSVPSGIDRISLTFLAGGGSPALTYTNTSLNLNYNLGNPVVASSSFSALSAGQTNTPVGTLDLTSYTWAWTNLSLLGSSSTFSIGWTAPAQHAFVTDISVTQAVPESSTLALLVLGAAVLWFARGKKKKSHANLGPKCPHRRPFAS